MRYYSTQRPIGPGTFPRQDGTETVINFDGPTYCEEIGREAWGYIEYQHDLEPSVCSRYELTPGGTEGHVLLGTDNEGKQVAFIPDTLTEDVGGTRTTKDLTRNDIAIGPNVEVDTETGMVTAYVETWFDVDEKFGTHTKDDDSGWVNFYVYYCPQTGNLSAEYVVSSDLKDEVYPYIPTESEKKLFVEMMEETSLQAHGVSLEELVQKEVEEDLER